MAIVRAVAVKACCQRILWVIGEAETDVKKAARVAVARPTPANLQNLADARAARSNKREHFERHRTECDADLTAKPLPKGPAPKPVKLAEPKVDRRRVPKVMPSRAEMQAAQAAAFAPKAASVPVVASRVAPHPSAPTTGDARMASPTGQCLNCARVISGERRFCGPCLAERRA